MNDLKEFSGSSPLPPEGSASEAAPANISDDHDYRTSGEYLFAVQRACMGALVAVAEHAAELETKNHQLEILSGRDTLTGLHNRRALHEAYDRLQKQYDPENRRTPPENETYLFVVDMDGLKEVNDKKGHEGGDELLRKIASVMVANVRVDNEDIVARWGGDEFVLLLPGITTERVEDVAQAILGDVPDKTEGSTVSIGIDRVNFRYRLEDIVMRADRALYAAKHNGKNQIAYVLES